MNQTDPVSDAILIERASRRTIEAARWRNPSFAPSSTGLHHILGAICDRAVDGILSGHGVWQVVSAPPGHGKSEMLGRSMPTRLALAMPGAKVLYATSTDERAEEVSTAVRSAMERLHAAGVPGKAPGRVWRATQWETEDGTGWVGVGANSATGGLRANLIVWDDVTGSGLRASSAAFRRHTQRWLDEDILSRDYGEHVSVVGMETRRGPMDLRAWSEQQYGDRLERYDIMCRADRDEGWRSAGDFAWPERYGRAWFDGKPSINAGGRVWETLYQQRPTAVEGDSIKRAWFAERRYREDPREIAKRADRIVLAVDCAASPESRADWTVIQAWAQIGADFYLLDEARGQWDINEQEAQLVRMAGLWTRRPADSIVVERSSNGIALQQRTATTLRTRSVTTATKDREDATASTAKERRAYEFIGAARNGRVWVPVGPKGDATIDEWVSLGTEAPDDRLDAAAHAINEFAAVVLPVAQRISLGGRI